MKAILYYQYGSPEVLQLQEIDPPVIGDHDVLVRVCAAAANPADWRLMRGSPYFLRLFLGLFKPKANGLGSELAGQVEAVGKKVTQFQPGDEVYGRVNGAFTEYICVPEEEALVSKPANLTFEQAAGVPLAALTALQGLRDGGRIQPGQKVLINGASGGVGTFAVQIAKAFGAEVTGVCSTRNLDMVRSLGADRVIDYTQEDFTLDKTLGEHGYDLMLDMVGNRSLSECVRVLTQQGTYVILSAPDGDRWLGPLGQILKVLLISPFAPQRVVTLDMKRNKADLLLLKEMIETGKVAPVIDRHYQLSEVPEAIRYLEEGHAQGKVVITVSKFSRHL